MNRPNAEVQQRMALVQEADAVALLLKRGIESINERSSVVIDPEVTLQLLSQGLERLLKLTVVFQHHRDHGELRPVRGYNHDVSRLAEAVLRSARGYEQSTDFRVLVADLEFAAADPTLKLLLSSLGSFGSGDRYHHLSAATGGQPAMDQAPKLAWEAIEASVRNDDHELLERLMSLDTATHNAGIEEINRRVTAIVQQYIRFVARFWAFAPTGDLARQFSGVLRSWLMLNDEQLGDSV